MAEVPESFSDEELSAILGQRTLIAQLEKTAFSKLPLLPPFFEEFWANIPLSDGWISQTLVVRPKPITVEDLNGWRHSGILRTFKSRPLIIYFHAGGFAAGTPPQVLLPARQFAIEFNATVLCPSYRLMPEHTWPQGAKDGMDLVQCVSANHVLHYGAIPNDGFMLAGASAGGCIASVVAALVSAYPKKYPLQHPLTALYSAIPLLLVKDIVPPEYKSMWTSSVNNSDYSGLGSIAVTSVLTNLEPHEYRSPWFSPINLLSEAVNQSGGHDQSTLLAALVQNHPPTYIQANGKDPLRDDALIYEKLLTRLGVPTKLHLFPDDAHISFSTLSLLMEGNSQNPTLREGTMEGVAWLLSKRDWLSMAAEQYHNALPSATDSATSITATSRSQDKQSTRESSFQNNTIDKSPVESQSPLSTVLCTDECA